MAKRSTSLVGYVHGLSPSKTKSFRLQVQTDKGFKKAICFDTTKYETLKNKQISGEPIKLSVLPQDQQQKYHSDIVINRSTKVSDVDEVAMTFKRKEPEVDYHPLHQSFDIDALVSVRGRLDLKRSNKNNVFVRGKNVCVLNGGIVYNDTGSVMFTAWGQWIPYLEDLVKNGNDYLAFHNMLVGTYQDEIQLSTCSDTTIEVIKDADKPLEKDLSMESDEWIEEFESIKEVKFWYLCQQCGKTIPYTKENLVECEYCSNTMRAKNLKKQMVVVLKCEGDPNYYTATGSEFSDLIEIDTTNLCDKSLLINQIMALNDIHIVKNTMDMTLRIVPE